MGEASIKTPRANNNYALANVNVSLDATMNRVDIIGGPTWSDIRRACRLYATEETTHDGAAIPTPATPISANAANAANGGQTPARRGPGRKPMSAAARAKIAAGLAKARQAKARKSHHAQTLTAGVAG